MFSINVSVGYFCDKKNLYVADIIIAGVLHGSWRADTFAEHSRSNVSLEGGLGRKEGNFSDL